MTTSDGRIPTTRPRLRLGRHLAPGLLAVALFGAMAAIVLNTGFTGTMDTDAFADVAVTEEIGYALFGFTEMQSGAVADTENFLVALILIAVVLDAALDASLVLAKREEDGRPVSPLSTTSPTTSAGEASGPVGPAATDGGRDGDSAVTDGGQSETSVKADGSDGSGSTIDAGDDDLVGGDGA